MSCAWARALRSIVSTALATSACSRRRAAQHVRPAEDGVERRAQLVRQRGQELVLHAARPARRRPRGALGREQLLALASRGFCALMSMVTPSKRSRGPAGGAERHPLARSHRKAPPGDTVRNSMSQGAAVVDGVRHAGPHPQVVLRVDQALQSPRCPPRRVSARRARSALGRVGFHSTSPRGKRAVEGAELARPLGEREGFGGQRVAPWRAARPRTERALLGGARGAALRGAAGSRIGGGVPAGRIVPHSTGSRHARVVRATPRCPARCERAPGVARPARRRACRQHHERQVGPRGLGFQPVPRATAARAGRASSVMKTVPAPSSRAVSSAPGGGQTSTVSMPALHQHLARSRTASRPRGRSTRTRVPKSVTEPAFGKESPLAAGHHGVSRPGR